jgi:hypothetical protein
LAKATCRGESVDYAVKKGVVTASVSDYVEGRALSCYVATYLGCTYGEWIAQARSGYGPDTRAFTLSKVTIIEQTSNKIVADVTEASPENLQDGVLGEWDDAKGEWIPWKGDLSAYDKQVSRFTLTRGRDGLWRISDRKPPFKWICSPRD